MWAYLRHVIGVLLCAISLVSQAQVIISAERDSPAVRSFAQDLANTMPALTVTYMPRAQLEAQPRFAENTRLILLGPALLKWRLQLTHSQPATLIMQVSRVQAYQQLQEQQPEHLTLLWSDPALERQIALLKAMQPDVKNIGLLYGDYSAFLLNDIEQAIQAQGLTLHTYYWPDSYDARSLGRLLTKTDALLGLDDLQIYNSSSIKSILLSSYARQQALIGPTAAFIKAGSLSTTYSDKHDWLQSLQLLLQSPPESWPRSAYPDHFKVSVNEQVARSLGIQNSDPQQLAQQLKHSRPTP